MPRRYAWLEKEIAEIRTNKFHQVHQPMPEEFRAIEWPHPPPPSFREFVDMFGTARLYRENGSHLLWVYEKSKASSSRDGDTLLCFGGYGSRSAAFRLSQLREKTEAPVHEDYGVAAYHEKARDFPSWLNERARFARKQFGKRKWQHVLAGPSPFTDEERAIVEARRQYRWKVVGVTAKRDLRLEVTNASDRRIPWLTVGVRSPRLIGQIRVPVGGIAPGQTAVVECDAYRDLADPHTVEIRDVPEPGPEDRDLYWEFRPDEDY